MKCFKCDRGYLVAEYSSSERKTNYYCNYCFKYSELSKEGAGPELAMIQDAVEESLGWEDMTDEELTKILDDLFKDICMH